MQSLSLTLSKRLSNSRPLFRISSNFLSYTSSTTSSPSPPPSNPPASPLSGPSTPTNSATPTLTNLLNAPWSAIPTRGITVSGSDVRVGNLTQNQGRIHEVLKHYHSHGGKGKAAVKVPPHSIAGYATVTSSKDDIERKERNSGLRSESPKTKREQLLKVTAVLPLLLIYPNAYSMLLANLFLFWHIDAGIEEILADYVHQEMTRNFIMISFRLFLIIAMKDVFLKFVFV